MRPVKFVRGLFNVLAWISLVSTANAQPAPPVIVRVDATSQNPNGSGFPNWSDAFDNLDDALEYARQHNVDELWVAAVPGPPPGPPLNWQYGNRGAYLPTVRNPTNSTDPRTVTFLIDSALNGVKILGGFKGLAQGGGETMASQRDPIANVTILAAALTYAGGQPYHTLTIENVGPSTIIDGFLIVHAYADGTGTNQDRGGGILIRNASPIIARCILNHNYALNAGCGIYLDSNLPGSPLRLFNCALIDNHATPTDEAVGGVLYNNGGRIEMMNCQVSANKTTNNGAGIYNNDGDLTIINGTITCHSFANLGGGIYCIGDGLVVRNSILWGNSRSSQTSREQMQIYLPEGSSADVKFSCIEDNAPGGTIPFGGGANHNMDENPWPVPHGTCDGAFDRLPIPINSPAVGRGDCAIVPDDLADLNQDGTTTGQKTPDDLNGDPRFSQRIDLGAFEVLLLCAGDANFDGVVNIDDLVVVINHWGSCPPSSPPCPGDLTPAGAACGNDSVDIDDLVAIITTWGCGQQNPESPPQSVLDCLTQYSDNMGKLQACIEAMLWGGTP